MSFWIGLVLAVVLSALLLVAAGSRPPRMEVNWWRAQNCLYAANPETKEGYGEPANLCPRVEQDI